MVMEIGFLLALIALICLVIALAYRVDALSAELSTRLTSQERAVNASLAALQGSREGKVLREAARRWESPAEQTNLRSLASERYRAGGPSMPYIWLNALADEAEGVVGCDGHEHTIGGECLL